MEIGTEWSEDLLTNNNGFSFLSGHCASERIDGGA